MNDRNGIPLNENVGGIATGRPADYVAPTIEEVLASVPSPARRPIYVANFSGESFLEADRDDPNVRRMDLVDHAWPVCCAASLDLDEAIASAKSQAEADYSFSNEGEDGVPEFTWSAPFKSQTGSAAAFGSGDGASEAPYHWRVLGSFTFRYNNPGDFAAGIEKYAVVVREM